MCCSARKASCSTDPVGYTPDVDEYKAFLERGLQGMEELKERKASNATC